MLPPGFSIYPIVWNPADAHERSYIVIVMLTRSSESILIKVAAVMLVKIYIVNMA